MPLSAWPTLSIENAAGPAPSANAPAIAPTASSLRPPPSRSAGDAAIATAAATGTAMRSHGAKSGVRARISTASQAEPASVTSRSATANQERRAQPHSATTPPPQSAATAGASALT